MGFRFESIHWLPLAGALILVSGIALWLMQRKLHSNGWSSACRFLAIAAISICLAKPSIVRTAANSADGDWLILLDQSRSMSVSDPGRSSAQCVALAEAIGDIPSNTRPVVGADLVEQARRLSGLQDSVESAASEIDFAQLGGHDAAGAARRLVAALHSLRDAAATLQQCATDQRDAVRLFDTCREIVRQIDRQLTSKRPIEIGVTRSEPRWIQLLRRTVSGAESAAEQPQDSADAALYSSDPQAHSAADAVAASSRIDLAARAIAANEPAGVHFIEYGAEPSLPPLSISGDSSPAADRDSSDLNGAVAAAETKAAQSNARAIVLISDGRQVNARANLPTFDVPIIAVNAGAAAVPDVAIAEAELPAELYVSEPATARVILLASGVHEEPVNVTVNDGSLSFAQQINCTDGRTVATVPLQFNSPGLFDLQIQITPTAYDGYPQNNQVHRWVRVIDQSIGVGLLASAGGPNADALQNAIQGTSWFLPQNMQSAFPSNVLILHDVQPKLLTPKQWTALLNWVRAGGGLIMVAGADTSAPALQEIPGAGDLFPWREDSPPQWREQSADPFHIGSAEAALISRSGAASADDRKRWEQLPPLRTILSVDAPKPGVTPLLTESSSGEPIITEQHVDAGRIIFVGFRDAYRWRSLLSEREPDLFWLNLIHLAAERPYAMSNSEFDFDVSPPALALGHSFDIRLRQRNLADKSLPSVSLIRDGQTATRVDLHPLAKSPNNSRFVGTAVLAAKGDYQVRLNTTPPLDIPIHLKAEDEAEMRDLNPDENYLRGLARASGGDYLRLDEIPYLPQRVQNVLDRSPRVSTISLWDSAGIYWFVLGCLALEWSARKRVGLL